MRRVVDMQNALLADAISAALRIFSSCYEVQILKAVQLGILLSPGESIKDTTKTIGKRLAYGGDHFSDGDIIG